MLNAQVKFVSWGKIYNFSVDQLKLLPGDSVMVNTELGLELGKVIALSEEASDLVPKSKLELVLRKASSDDLAKVPGISRKKEVLDFCRELIEKHNLAMRLIDVYFSWEGNRFDFAFTADGRIDFRELVKDLSGYFNVSIRLTQVGTRDEAKITGDCGPCGRTLCCQTCLRKFCSISSEMAETQQVVNRGSDRISGMCGRLKCCLSFEYEGYKLLAGKLPACGTKVNVDGSHGVVIQQHILKQTVEVRIPHKGSEERDIIIEVDINRHNRNINIF